MLTPLEEEVMSCSLLVSLVDEGLALAALGPLGRSYVARGRVTVHSPIAFQ